MPDRVSEAPGAETHPTRKRKGMADAGNGQPMPEPAALSWWKKTVPIDDTLSIQPPSCDGVLAAVMELPPKYRVVIYLHYYEGYTTAHIAKLLKISQTAVTTRLSRGRKALEEKLKEV